MNINTMNMNDGMDAKAYVTTVPQWIASCLDEVQNKVVERLMFGTWQLDNATASDLAAAGLEYALRPALRGYGAWPHDIQHLERTAYKIACLRATDLYRRKRRQPWMVSTDETWVDADGEERESRALEQKAAELFRAEQQNRDNAELAAIAWKRRNAMFDELGLSDMKRGVFIEAYLFGRPVRKVAEKYGIARNYVYGIVFGVKEGLARIGPGYLEAV